jgi:hypothetical protein
VHFLAGGNSKSYGNLGLILAEFGGSSGGESNFSFSYSCLIPIFYLIWSIAKIGIIFPPDAARAQASFHRRFDV